VPWSTVVDGFRNVKEFPSKSECLLISFATFGEKRTEAGSLRHDANLIEHHGILGDYDGEAVSVSEATEMLADAGITAVIYTSPSHTPEKPRWRVAAPLSKAYPTSDYARLVARLNGVLHGILAPESFRPSQSYYFGRVNGATKHYQVQEVRGAFLDLRADLDASAIEQEQAGTTRAARLEQIRSDDPVIARLAELGMVLRQRADGGVDITCPFSADHTTQGGKGDTTYFAANTGGFKHGRFVCLHRCKDRPNEDFLEAIGLTTKPIESGNEQVTPDTKEMVEKLAKLKPIEYDKQRKEVAANLGVSVTALDAEVRAARSSDRSAGTIEFEAVEPWPEEVNGEELLDEVSALILRYLVIPDNSRQHRNLCPASVRSLP